MPRVVEKVGLRAVANVACGGDHTVAVFRDGTLFSTFFLPHPFLRPLSRKGRHRERFL